MTGEDTDAAGDAGGSGLVAGLPLDSADELAGIVDLFGALTRSELRRAVEELAFKRGDEVEADAVRAAVDEAVDRYVLVASERDGRDLLTVGPVAFPTLPADAEDLPHILDVDARTVERADLAEGVEARFRADAARAVNEGDLPRIHRLLDASYDLEAWGPISVGAVRDRLDAAVDELEDGDGDGDENG